MSLAIISETAVRKVVSRSLAFNAVAQAFKLIAANAATLCEVVSASLEGSPNSFAIKAGFENTGNTVGFKCGTYWPGNAARTLPAHSSSVLLLDPDSGFPKCLLSAGYLNGFRTAAANAVAVSVLARDNASVLGVLGAGHQAEHEIRALTEVRELSLIKIFSRSESRAQWLRHRLNDLEIDIGLTSAEEAVRDSDIVTTVTPSTTPLVEQSWVAAGTHVSAMGADAPGKQELDSALLGNASLFADYPPQSVRIGEFQAAFREGLISSVQEIGAIGDVLLGVAKGRLNDDEITVFDSSGVALQDLLVASALYDEADKGNLIDRIDF
ncbi:MAG: ornithine cyclodeaminase family protein [Xanthomonadales bacterium]|nr:ornithine cyclodeaminase family protein [Xanthomonadales bacterium]